MPKFKFTITHNTTMSAQVEVEADSIEEAQERALTREVHENAHWELDEGNPVGEVYLPDPSDYDIVGSNLKP